MKNCFFFKNKYFFFFCERYCEKFHLTKASQILDGDLKQLKKFVDFIMKNRHKVFYYPNNNILLDWVGYYESFLKENYDEAMRDEVLIRATTKKVQLDEFETDVVYWEGMDPEEATGSNSYPLDISLTQIKSWTTIAVLIFII